jgi:uncharacterized protein
MGHCGSSTRIGGPPRRRCGLRSEAGASGVLAAERRTRPIAAQRAPVAPEISAPARLLIFLVRCYQLSFSPLMASPCKFYPSCSRYAEEALRLHGARHGCWLALKRLVRCRPFSPGGVDFPPARYNSGTQRQGNDSPLGNAEGDPTDSSWLRALSPGENKP